MQTYPNLELSIHDRVLVVTINRPERRNAIDGHTAQALYEAFTDFDADGDLDIAVLTGAGGAFCAGFDLKSLSQGVGENPVKDGGINSLGPVGPTRMRLSKPVIAAIEGHAVAGGMELALWCDMRVMGSDAIFGIFCRRFGVPLVDMGTIRLPRLIGQSRAMDLILTGRPVNAEEALQIGLANRLAAPGGALEEALTLARELSRLPQTCMRNDRLSMLAQWSLDEDSAIAHEMKLGLATIASGESVAGATRFTQGSGRHGRPE